MRHRIDGLGVSFCGAASYALGVLVLLGLGAGAIAWSIEHFKRERNVPITSLNGIALGETKADVQFKADKEIIIWENAPAGTEQLSVRLHDSWVFLTLRSNVVISVAADCKGDAQYVYINRISCGDSAEKIVQRFGPAAERWCNREDPGQRSYFVKEYGVAYSLKANKVDGFLIGDDPNRVRGTKWFTC